ncbi:MAG: ABC transporter substrate-binding protein [Bacillota bacterium]
MALWVFVVVLLMVFSTGTLGGYRYNSGQWPWEPAVTVTAGGQERPDSVQSNILVPSSPKKQDPALQHYLRSVVSINVRGERGSKTGSGFLIDTGGHIVTSAHVVDGARGCVNVIDDNGTTHLGTVVNQDRNLDVAMIYVPTLKKWADVLTIRETPLAQGDQVYVLGSPKGTPNSTLLKAQVEVVGLSKRIDDRYYANLVEFAGAAVVHGSSGSPLLHRESGEVVGVVTAAADTSIAYAVPVDQDMRELLKEWADSPVPNECGAPTATKTVDLVLATITPLSGTHGVWGHDLMSGAELALRDMEADLAKVGYRVSLAAHDDQGQPSTAAELAKMVAYDREVIGVVGSFTSQVSAVIAETLQESSLVIIAPTAGADELTLRGWRHFNRIVPSNARLEGSAATFAGIRLKARSVLMVLDGSTIAEGRAASFEATAQILSLPIVSRLKLTGPVETASLKQQVIDSGADVIYYAGNSQTGFQVAQALRQESIMLPIIGGPDLYNPAFESMTSPLWRGIYFTHFTNGTDERFERHFETILGKPTRGYGMYGYDAARVILEALIRYGEQNPAQVPDRVKLAELVRSTREHPGWSSTITFDPSSGENQASRVFIFEWVGGHYELRE